MPEGYNPSASTGDKKEGRADMHSCLLTSPFLDMSSFTYRNTYTNMHTPTYTQIKKNLLFEIKSETKFA